MAERKQKTNKRYQGGGREHAWSEKYQAAQELPGLGMEQIMYDLEERCARPPKAGKKRVKLKKTNRIENFF